MPKNIRITLDEGKWIEFNEVKGEETWYDILLRGIKSKKEEKKSG